MDVAAAANWLRPARVALFALAIITVFVDGGQIFLTTHIDDDAGVDVRAASQSHDLLVWYEMGDV